MLKPKHEPGEFLRLTPDATSCVQRAQAGLAVAAGARAELAGTAAASRGPPGPFLMSSLGPSGSVDDIDSDEQGTMTSKPVRDGWHGLPSGGAVEIKDGIPVRVSDKGRWILEESKMLAEAAQLTEMRLTWRTLRRSQRWQSNNLLTVFRRGDYYEWCLAYVLVGACELCGEEVGVRWMKYVLDDSPTWVGEECARDSSEVKR